MRPAQLRRFGSSKRGEGPGLATGFNEAGAAAPVWHQEPYPDVVDDFRFNEAGAAAPVWPSKAMHCSTWHLRRFNEAGAAAPVWPLNYAHNAIPAFLLQ